MRFPTVFLLAATAAGAAFAQDAQPPAEPPAKAEEPAPGLSGLRETVQDLEDAQPPAETPPAEPPAATPPTETPPAPPPQPTAPARPPEPLTRAQRGQLEAAAARGRLLAAIARAGQVATQDMLSRVSDPDGAGITGWIAEPEGNGVAVTFYADGDAGPAAVYRANVLGGRVQGREVHLAGARPPLNPIQARMAAARAATAGLDHRVCGGSDFNALVVPPTTPDGPIDVYQISPQSARGRFPIGGHYKTIVAADGSVAASRGFTNACIDAAAADPAPGAQPAPIAVTHLMDELPTEIHVFLSIWTGHPLVVVAGDPQRLFAVTPDRIAEIPR